MTNPDLRGTPLGTEETDHPDRAAYRADPDRQAAILAQVRRVAEMGLAGECPMGHFDWVRRPDPRYRLGYFLRCRACHLRREVDRRHRKVRRADRERKRAWRAAQRDTK